MARCDRWHGIVWHVAPQPVAGAPHILRVTDQYGGSPALHIRHALRP
jgi:hypothetical protein